MTIQVNHKELKELVKQYYKNKIALFNWGRFGIGKSMVVCESAKEIAKEKNREFVEWNKLDEKKRTDVFNNPEKYFVFIDIRLSEYDSSDIKGLPEFREGHKSIEFKVPIWALFMENEKSDGILFFDEINLATPIVISSCYKIIYDRIVNNSKVSNDWLIMGAGNTSEDRAYTHEVAPPLRDRGGEVELSVPDIEDWTNWAVKHNIDSRIIGFLNFKNSNLWCVDLDDKQKFTTPRGWERVSNLINGLTYKNMRVICSSAIGEGIASEFVSFCKIQEKLKLEEIIKNPKKIKDIEDISIKYFLITAVADKYKNEDIDIKKVMEISTELDKINSPEFVALLWKICYGYTDKFKKDFIKVVSVDMVEKYSKYLID